MRFERGLSGTDVVPTRSTRLIATVRDGQASALTLKTSTGAQLQDQHLKSLEAIRAVERERHWAREPISDYDRMYAYMGEVVASNTSLIDVIEAAEDLHEQSHLDYFLQSLGADYSSSPALARVLSPPKAAKGWRQPPPRRNRPQKPSPSVTLPPLVPTKKRTGKPPTKKVDYSALLAEQQAEIDAITKSEAQYQRTLELFYESQEVALQKLTEIEQQATIFGFQETLLGDETPPPRPDSGAMDTNKASGLEPNKPLETTTQQQRPPRPASSQRDGRAGSRPPSRPGSRSGARSASRARASSRPSSRGSSRASSAGSAQ
eukprot:TRINITY_DN78038_c0_g1_i1.p1 TRINITY_DN78038_c0_g1~~TRINITY_DN78038_c0_g1_i1.p1  ORF type:complete len:319 (+),score=22.30 TRINITY_DN78038_c0_g1_i1:21-977(+)